MIEEKKNKKSILLSLDEEFFYKMVEDKYKKEKELGDNLTWPKYIEILFGISKVKNKNG